MKKLVFMAVAVFMLAATAQAQLYVGGSFGLGSQSGSSKCDNKATKEPSAFTFSLKPEVGYFVQDDLALGVRPFFALESENNRQDPATVTTTTTFGLEPFVDFYLAEFGDFRFLLEATLPFGYTKGKTKIGSTSTSGDPTINLGVNIIPVIGYGLNDHWTLRAGLNFLQVGFGMERTSGNLSGIKYTETNMEFKLGADMNNVFTSGLLQVGAVYAF